jgi:hypothetical protein
METSSQWHKCFSTIIKLEKECKIFRKSKGSLFTETLFERSGSQGRYKSGSSNSGETNRRGKLSITQIRILENKFHTYILHLQSRRQPRSRLHVALLAQQGVSPLALAALLLVVVALVDLKDHLPCSRKLLSSVQETTRTQVTENWGKSYLGFFGRTFDKIRSGSLWGAVRTPRGKIIMLLPCRLIGGSTLRIIDVAAEIWASRDVDLSLIFGR